jgi:hypothetical protein
MTFGSTFGRVFSPTFQPSSQAAAASSWWLAGGIDPANCLFAYQARSMLDKASTKVNLANPGTHNLIEVGNVEWDTVNGWKNTQYSGGNYFYIDSIAMPAGNSATFIEKADPPINSSASFGHHNLYCSYHVTSHYTMYWRGNEPIVSGWRGVEAVYCYAGGNVYINGDLKTLSTPNANTGTYKIYIGTNQTYAYTPMESVKAQALYNVVLSASQIAAVTAAIDAL